MKLACALVLITASLAAAPATFAASGKPPAIAYPDLGGPLAGGMSVDARSLVRDMAQPDVNPAWLLASGDDDDDDEDEGAKENDGDCNEGGESADCAATDIGTPGNAAKPSTAAPPQNGLFTNGTAPIVKSN